VAELTWRGRLLVLTMVSAWVVGVLLSLHAAPLETLQRSSIAAEIAAFASLRPHVAGAREIDYLMDLDPDSGRHPGSVLRGRRFKAQYALAPALVERRRQRHHAIRHAGRVLDAGQPYFLVWDPAFFSPLEAVVGDLQQVARAHQARLDVHHGQDGLVVISVRGD
jgi:hypothetical protein